MGTLQLLVPQDREEGTFRTQLFARYQRKEKALVLALMEMHVQGVSTRKVKEVTEKLCATAFSKSTVSRLASELRVEEPPAGGRGLPLPLRGCQLRKVRIGSRVVSEGVLVVSAVRDDGFREILAVEVADVESEATPTRSCFAL